MCIFTGLLIFSMKNVILVLPFRYKQHIFSCFFFESYIYNPGYCANPAALCKIVLEICIVNSVR